MFVLQELRWEWNEKNCFWLFLCNGMNHSHSISNPNVGKGKVHEFPNRETTPQDRDMDSFGTGFATY